LWSFTAPRKDTSNTHGRNRLTVTRPSEAVLVPCREFDWRGALRSTSSAFGGCPWQACHNSGSRPDGRALAPIRNLPGGGVESVAWMPTWSGPRAWVSWRQVAKRPRR
jgi:hypothetical protein